MASKHVERRFHQKERRAYTAEVKNLSFSEGQV